MTYDILVISGGGDWGAFGAGVPKGWRRVTGEFARPHFDVVTGVSTGELIAPFAFLGDEASIDRILQMYRNPQEGIVNLLATRMVWQSCSMSTVTPATRCKNHRFPAEIISHAVWLYLELR